MNEGCLSWATKFRLLRGSPTATHSATTDVTPRATTPSLPRSGFVQQAASCNHYQPFCFDDFTLLQPQPLDRRAPPLVVVHVLIVG